MTAKQQAQLFQVLAGILHLGNVEFVDDETAAAAAKNGGDGDGGEPCLVKNYGQIALVADLLGVSCVFFLFFRIVFFIIRIIILIFT